MSETLNIFGRDHIMVDTETLSQRPNAAIVSIGAVLFTFEDGIKDEFLINVDPVSCHKAGLHIDKDSVAWWADQPKEVSAMWKKDPQSIHTAMKEYNDFIGVDKNQLIWCQGGSFDHPIISSAMRACDIERNWKYWQEMDSRTVFTLLGVRNDKIREKSADNHSALGDAISQTNTLIGLFK